MPSPFRSTVLAKAIMALTGMVLVAWTMLHVAGNLLTLLGPELVNRYGAQLHDSPLLWVQRAGLLIATVVHLSLASHLAARSRAAIGPLRRSSGGTMRTTGVALGLLALFHIAHVYGALHPSYVPGDVHHNLVTSARTPLGGALLVALTALVGAHLRHGAQSSLVSLGWGSDAWPRPLRAMVNALPWLIIVGFCLPIFYALAT